MNLPRHAFQYIIHLAGKKSEPNRRLWWQSHCPERKTFLEPLTLETNCDRPTVKFDFSINSMFMCDKAIHRSVDTCWDHKEPTSVAVLFPQFQRIQSHENGYKK